MTGTNLIANTAGILSLISSLAVVHPIFFRTSQKNISYRKLIANISYTGLMLTICLGLVHGLLTTQMANISYSDINTYWIYAGGLFVFNLFIFMAIAFPELKHNFQKFNCFNYAILVLLVIHVGQKIVF